MIAGSDYTEISHENDVVTLTVRQNGHTSTAHLPVFKAIEVSAKLTAHINAAQAWCPPSLVEYTGSGDLT